MNYQFKVGQRVLKFKGAYSPYTMRVTKVLLPDIGRSHSSLAGNRLVTSTGAEMWETRSGLEGCQDAEYNYCPLDPTEYVIWRLQGGPKTPLG